MRSQIDKYLGKKIRNLKDFNYGVITRYLTTIPDIELSFDIFCKKQENFKARLLNCYCIFTNFDCRFLIILISSLTVFDLMESTSYQELVD